MRPASQSRPNLRSSRQGPTNEVKVSAEGIAEPPPTEDAPAVKPIADAPTVKPIACAAVVKPIACAAVVKPISCAAVVKPISCAAVVKPIACAAVVKPISCAARRTVEVTVESHTSPVVATVRSGKNSPRSPPSLDGDSAVEEDDVDEAGDLGSDTDYIVQKDEEEEDDDDSIPDEEDRYEQLEPKIAEEEDEDDDENGSVIVDSEEDDEDEDDKPLTSLKEKFEKSIGNRSAEKTQPTTINDRLTVQIVKSSIVDKKLIIGKVKKSNVGIK